MPADPEAAPAGAAAGAPDGGAAKAAAGSSDKAAAGVGEFQRLIERIYLEKDRARGLEGTWLWFSEEVGELARALRRPDTSREHLEEEFADVLAWLATLASIRGLDLERAVTRKYGAGCPYCGATPCACP